jgi:H+/Cl- antiporter ClcA
MIVHSREMNEMLRRLIWWGSLAATVLATALGATIVIAFFTDHYLDLALPIVKKVYGTQESVPIAFDRGLRLCFLCATLVIGGMAGMIIMRKRRSNHTSDGIHQSANGLPKPSR